MQANGLGPDQVSQIRGYADQKLRSASDPLDPANRRITLIVQYVEKKDDEESGATAGEAKGTGNEGKEGEKPAEGGKH